MKSDKANLINSIALIVMGAWGCYATSLNSKTALIPVVGGIILLLCQNGIKKENKIIAHIAVVLTLVLVIGLFKPFSSAMADADYAAMARSGIMILTGIYAMLAFIQSFRNARKAK